jgi:hypothetical protein
VAAAASLTLAVAIGHSSDDRLWERVRSRSLAQVGAQSLTHVVGGTGAAGRRHGGGAPENASHAHRKLQLPALSAARVDADPVQSLRMCLLDKGKMNGEQGEGVIGKSKLFASCWQEECDNEDLGPEICRLSVQSFGECWEPFNDMRVDTLIETEACTQRLQSLSVDKYIEKHAAAFHGFMHFKK